MIIGLAELLGEGLTAFIADRLGLKRALFAGLVLSASSYVLIPFVDIPCLWRWPDCSSRLSPSNSPSSPEYPSLPRSCPARGGQ